MDRGPQNYDPIQSSYFLIQVGNSQGISAAFSRFSGVKMEVETIQTRSGNDSRGVKEYTPVFTSYAPVTLSKGVVGDTDFLKWVFSACAGEFTGPSAGNLRRTIDVIALDSSRNHRATWTLLGAMPIGYELSPMDGNRSEVLTENITFAITGVKRTMVPPPEKLIPPVTL